MRIFVMRRTRRRGGGGRTRGERASKNGNNQKHDDHANYSPDAATADRSVLHSLELKAIHL